MQEGIVLIMKKVDYIVTVHPCASRVLFAIRRASGDDGSVMPWVLYARSISLRASSNEARRDGGSDEVSGEEMSGRA